MRVRRRRASRASIRLCAPRRNRPSRRPHWRAGARRCAGCRAPRPPDTARRHARACSACRGSRSRRPRRCRASPSARAADAPGRGRCPRDARSPPGFSASGFRYRASRLLQTRSVSDGGPPPGLRGLEKTKKGPANEGQPMKVFRRGCLKGEVFLRRGGSCCKCEWIRYDCANCNRRLQCGQ
ncbi:hypothetical protein SPHINGOT1_130162 [Sphingomonas sp. T1]|nr:hypothetical protein SPHINGOT1_130162 [Sphingomonas sp. T1]